MKNNFWNKTICSMFLTFVAMPNIMAQSFDSPTKPRVEKKQTLQQRLDRMEKFREKYPLLASNILLGAPKSNLPQAKKPGTPVTLAPRVNVPFKAPSGTVIWANVYTSDHYGYFQFKPQASITPEALNEEPLQTKLISRYGVQLKGSKLYGVYADMAYADYGAQYVQPYRLAYNIADWSTRDDETGYFPSYNCGLIAQETAMADDGTVYGEFFKSDLSGYEWGTVDYETEQRTSFGDAEHKFVAIGITSKKKLYGVAADGNLYSISTTDGTETLIGPTGLELTKTDEYGSAVYSQTGEIDQRTDIFYWAAVDANGNTGLYTVDLQTGKATKIGDFGSQTAMVGMVIPQDMADNDAPAQATNAKVVFDGESLSGTFSFTAPATTFSGDDISGNLPYSVTVNGEEVATGTAEAGTEVSVPVKVERSGSYDFAVTFSNDYGRSPRASVTQWVGKVAPNPAYDVMMIVDDNYQVDVTWRAPETNVNGDKLSGVTYDVYRCTPNKKELAAENITETSFNETLTSPELAEHFYEVYAKNGDAQSEAAKSNAQVFGDAIVPDYSEDFSTDKGIKLYTIIDVNGDGKTWKYDASNKCMRTDYSDEKKGSADDDWLITPKVRLTADRTYTVKFTARNRYPKFPNSLEVKWGNSNTPEALSNTGLAETVLPGDKTEYSFDIAPEADGDFYVGFHDIAPKADNGVIYLESVEITANALLSSPAAPENLTVTPGAKGELSATVSFNAPAKNAKGENIESLDKIAVKRNGKLIKEFGKTEAGKNLSFVDNEVPMDGNTTYEVAGYVDDACGNWASASVWVGTDTPLNPANVRLADNTSSIRGYWDKFGDKGEHGGYADPSKVQVSLYSIEDYGDQKYLGSQIASSQPGENYANINLDPETSINGDGKQSFFNVAAHTEGRERIATNFVFSSSMVVGPSIKPPFQESFANGYVDNDICWTENNDAVDNRSTASQWMTSTWDSSDADEGCAVWAPHQIGDQVYTIKNGDESAFCLAKVSLANASSPKLTFDYNVQGPAALDVIAKLPDGTEKVVKTLDFSAGQTGWKTCSVDLNELKSERYIICKFNGKSLANNISMYIDNVNVVNDVPYNLKATSISVADNLKTGRTANVKVGVKNLGSEAAAGYTVTLYQDGESVAQKTIDEALAPMAETTVELSYQVAPNASGNAKLYAVVDFAQDSDTSDNTTESKTVNFSPVNTAVVNDLEMETAASGVNLKWTEPSEQPAETVTETFDSYAPWSTSFGDWTLVDGNNAEACNFFDGYESPFYKKKFAFIIFDPNSLLEGYDILGTYPGFDGHGGGQYAAVPYEWTDNTGNDESGFVDGDNWLISPRLSGNAQTISFYVNNVQIDETGACKETFDVLISKSGKNTDNFVKVGATRVADGQNMISDDTNWKLVTVNAPKGTNYFAIHQNTPASTAFLFGVDDVTYEVGAECANDEVAGYNIYRNAKKIATVDGTTLSYNDTEAESGDYYNVTILFKDSDGNITESAFSNTATVTSSIETIESCVKASSYDVYTLDGKTIMTGAASLKGLQPGAYIINGRKFVLK